jgi:hypothetical protein
MSEIGKATLALFGVLLFFFALTTGAFGQTTRSHACFELSDAKVLANHLAEPTKGWLGYNELFASLHAEGKCIPVLIPVPAPTRPLWQTSTTTFDVGVFPLIIERRAVYGLLLGRYPQLSGV